MVVLANNMHASVGIKVVQKFDTNLYNPVDEGLRDLVFELRFSNLAEMINKKKSFGKIDKVFFKVYWNYPKKLKVEVIGIPSGLMHLKVELIKMVVGNMDYIMPKKLLDTLHGYELTSKKKEQGIFVKGVDKTYKKNVNQIHMHFQENGALELLKMLSPHGTTDTTFTSSKKPWSKNKFVLDENEVRSYPGGNTVITTNSITYKVVEKIGLPEQVVNVTKQVFTGNKKSKTIESQRVITFSKYKVNTGEANKLFNSFRVR